MANFDDNWDLYVVNSDGSNVQRLTTNPAVVELVPAVCTPPLANISPARVRTMTIRNTCPKLATDRKSVV